MKKLTIEEAERMMKKKNGNLALFGSDIEELPDNLNVNGNLDLFCSKIKKLPKNLTVNGSLDIEYTKITKLPDNLTVKGDLYCKKDVIIPESVKIEGGIKRHEE